MKGWPELYMYPVYDRTYGDFPAKNTVCTPFIRRNVWGSGQSYSYDAVCTCRWSALQLPAYV